jgi:hypothetical protein
LTPRFFLYAGIAILAGIFLSVEHPTLIGESFEKAGLNLGTGYALVCALFWGLSTVAGRGAMIGMPLRLAASMRVVVGLICMTFILLIYGKLNRVSLWPPAAQAHITTAIVALLLLASISGRHPTSHLLRRIAADPRIHRRLLRNDANPRLRFASPGDFSMLLYIGTRSLPESC